MKTSWLVFGAVAVGVWYFFLRSKTGQTGASVGVTIGQGTSNPAFMPKTLRTIT